MNITLILMRHAKSSWGDPWLADHDRPLNNRGQSSSVALGQWLRSGNLAPDEVICSSARRTFETFEGLGLPLEPVLTSNLYHAGSDQMLRVLQGAHGKCVLMIGHNPGIADFAERIASVPSSHPRFLDYPTGATTVVDFAQEDWKDIRFGLGTIRDFIIPRELPDQ